MVGDSADRGPEISVSLLYGTGTTVAGKVPASVVDFRSLGKGDVALLKVDKHNLPSSELATDADVSIGTSVLAVGFPESTQNITGPSLDPTNKSGKVSKKSSMGSAPEYEVDAAVTDGMSGGPTVELNGKVIGVNSFGPVGEPQPFNFIAPADSLAAILASKGVKPTLGPADVLYRKGLGHYYSGHYTEAIDEFDQTLAMSPDYPGLLNLKTSAVNLRQQYGDVTALSGAKLLWYIVGSVVLVLAAGAGLTLMVMRSRWYAAGPPNESGLRLVSGAPGRYRETGPRSGRHQNRRRPAHRPGPRGHGGGGTPLLLELWSRTPSCEISSAPTAESRSCPANRRWGPTTLADAYPAIGARVGDPAEHHRLLDAVEPVVDGIGEVVLPHVPRALGAGLGQRMQRPQHVAGVDVPGRLFGHRPRPRCG